MTDQPRTWAQWADEAVTALAHAHHRSVSPSQHAAIAHAILGALGDQPDPTKARRTLERLLAWPAWPDTTEIVGLMRHCRAPYRAKERGERAPEDLVRGELAKARQLLGGQP